MFVVFLFLVKKMSDQTHLCHEFMKEVVPFVGSFPRRRFVILDYNVNFDEFLIRTHYVKDQFEHLFHEYVCGMLDNLKNRELYDSGWDINIFLLKILKMLANIFLLQSL